MVPILLDTNVYLNSIRSAPGAAFFEHHFLPALFRTILSSVVVEELYAGALDAPAARLVERYVGPLERMGRVVTPAFRDWKDAGKLVARMTRTEPGRKSKLQELLNDILLALCARRSCFRCYAPYDHKLYREALAPVPCGRVAPQSCLVDSLSPESDGPCLLR